MKDFLSTAFLGLSLIICSSSYASMKDLYQKQESCNTSNLTHIRGADPSIKGYSSAEVFLLKNKKEKGICLTKNQKIYDIKWGYVGQIGSKKYSSGSIIEYSLENGDIYKYSCTGEIECVGTIYRTTLAREIGPNLHTSNENDAKSFYLKANQLVENGDRVELRRDQSALYRAALGYYSAAIDISPNFANAYLNRGFLNGALKNLEWACQDILKAYYLGHERLINWLQTKEASICRSEKYIQF